MNSIDFSPQVPQGTQELAFITFFLSFSSVALSHIISQDEMGVRIGVEVAWGFYPSLLVFGQGKPLQV
jgi:hypothetical protein